MSFKVMSIVLERSRHSGSNLLVLLALASYADDNGGNIWPTYATIAQKARVSRRQAISIVKHLLEAGPLKVVGRANSRANIYRIEIGEIGLERVGDSPAKSHEHDRNEAANWQDYDAAERLSDETDFDGDGEIGFTRQTPRSESDFTKTSEPDFTGQTPRGEPGFTEIGEPGFTRKVNSASPDPINISQNKSIRGAFAPRECASEKADRIFLEHASRDKTEKAIARVRCSEQARTLMKCFYALTGIQFSKNWPSACEEMAGAGVLEDDIRAAWAESKEGSRFAVNSPHSLKLTAIRIASRRKAEEARQTQTAKPAKPSVKYLYDPALGEYVEIKGG